MLIRSPKSLISRRTLLTGAGASAAYLALQPERVRAQSPCGTFFPTAPAPASAVGYNTLVYADDFNVAGTIGDASQLSGFNWYYIPGFNVQPANAIVSTAKTAAQVTNGNSGGGPNSSPLGGILQISGPATGGNNTTLLSTPASTHVTTPVKYGAYQHAYWEFYAQFDNNYVFNGDWYALWFFSQVNVPYQNGSLNFTQVGTEVDLMEAFCGNYGFPSNQQTGSGKQWTVPNVSGGGSYLSNGSAYDSLSGSTYTQINADSNWHTFGLLWVGPSGGTPGYTQFYIDNNLITFFGQGTSKNTTGTAVNGQGLSGTAGWQWIENSPLYMQMGGPPTGGSGGAGQGFLNVDWVRVWKSSYTVP